MLLAERLRSSEEQEYVKSAIEKHLKVTLDIDRLYYGSESDSNKFLAQLSDGSKYNTTVTSFVSSIAPTSNLRRLAAATTTTTTTTSCTLDLLFY
jgi:midasin (ATPase involved in ribosome maturation)